MAIGAAQDHAGILVHGVAVGAGVAGYAAGGFFVGVRNGLTLGGGRMRGVFDVRRFVARSKGVDGKYT